MWSLETVGFEVRADEPGTLEAEAYFVMPPSSAVEQLIAKAFSACGAQLVSVEEIPESDWHAGYRDSAQPFEVGFNWIVDPREPDDSFQVDQGGRHLLRIPARQAFGVGSHESTRLAVEMLEAEDLVGRRVLDVGTGSGILAMMALEMGAETVVALDIDPVAVILAAANGTLNNLPVALLAGQVDALRERPTFDLALINVLPAIIRDDLGAVASVMHASSEVVISGVTTGMEHSTLADWSAWGYRIEKRCCEGDWVAARLGRSSS